MNLKKKPNLIRNMLLTALTPAVGLGAAYSQAQVLEEVIVTAQKRAENLQDVPITLAVLGGDDLTNAGIDTQRMLSMMTPNVAINVNANFVAPYIRGIGTQYANPGLEPSVATYFNDIYMSRPAAGMLNFHDIERVEVLKGPQGTLYGRNTTGGAIRVITKDPTQEFEAGVGVTLGNYNKRGVDFYVSGPLAETVTGRLSGMIDKQDGWVENIGGGPDLQDRDLGFLHGKVHWEVTDKLNVEFAADYTRKWDHEGQAFQPLFPGLPEQVGIAFGGVASNDYDEFSGNFDREFRLNAGGVQLRIDYDINDSLVFSSITGFRYLRFQGFADLDATSASLFNAVTDLEKTEDYSQEFQLVSDGEGKLNWTTGVFLFYEDARDAFGLGGDFIDLGVGFPGAYTGGDGDIEVESAAWYGEMTYEFSDQFELLLGLRYTDETKKVENDFFVTSVDAGGRPTSPYLTTVVLPEQEVSFEELSPKIQLTWRPLDGVMLFASYQEGFKSGGFNMPSPSPAPVAEVDRELVKAYEIGWKAQFERLRINGAVFHYKLEDLQLQVTDVAGGITSIRNAGSAKVDGIEMDLTFAATDRLQLGAGFGWQEAEFGSVPNGQFFVPCAQAADYVARGLTSANTCAGRGGLGLEELSGNLKGNQLPQSPELSGYVRAAYTQPLASGGSLEFNLLVNYTDEFSWTGDNLFNEPSKTLANGNVTWRSQDEQYLFSVFGTNLTDEEYNTHQAPFSNSGGWKVPGNPRMYGVRFAVNF